MENFSEKFSENSPGEFSWSFSFSGKTLEEIEGIRSILKYRLDRYFSYLSQSFIPLEEKIENQVLTFHSSFLPSTNEEKNLSLINQDLELLFGYEFLSGSLLTPLALSKIPNYDRSVILSYDDYFLIKINNKDLLEEVRENIKYLQNDGYIVLKIPPEKEDKARRISDSWQVPLIFSSSNSENFFLDLPYDVIYFKLNLDVSFINENWLNYYLCISNEEIYPVRFYFPYQPDQEPLGTTETVSGAEFSFRGRRSILLWIVLMAYSKLFPSLLNYLSRCQIFNNNDIEVYLENLEQLKQLKEEVLIQRNSFNRIQYFPISTESEEGWKYRFYFYKNYPLLNTIQLNEMILISPTEEVIQKPSLEEVESLKEYWKILPTDASPEQLAGWISLPPLPGLIERLPEEIIIKNIK